MLIDSIVKGFARRASLESPQTPLTSNNIFSIIGTEAESASGISVTRDSALAHPVIYRGCQLIANDVAKLPLQVYRKDGMTREPAPRHPASRLLRKRVNPFMKAHTFIKTLVGHALLHRGGYAIISRSGAGTPLAMDVLDPEQTYPVFAEGKLMYQTKIGGRDVLLEGSDVFHIRGLGFDGLDGWSVIDKLRDAIGLGLAAQKYGAVYFANNAQPRVVIKFPGYLEDDEAIERFRHSWGSVHAGVTNAHKPAILEGGAEVEPFQINNSDSQFLELRQFDVRIISAILGVPPHKLGDNTRTSHASLEQENQSYLDEAIDPWLREIETECNDKLLTVDEHMSDSAFCEFTRSALIRTNLTDRVNAYNLAIMSGWMSRGEVRAKENLPPNDELDEFLVPLNMGVAGQVPVEPMDDEPPAEDDTDDRLESVARYEARRMVERVCKWLERAAKDPGSFIDSLDAIQDKHGHVWLEAFAALSDRADEIAGSTLEEIRAELLEVSGTVSAGQLESVVSQNLRAIETDVVPRLAARLLDKEI